MRKKYYLGLDIGTDSCGWAVTDENYNILTSSRKKLWGVRLFPEANSREDRRLKRGNRRRLNRRKLKINWLNEIFLEELNKVDDMFLTRIKYSSLYEEDKNLFGVNEKDSLFNFEIEGKKYTDKDYYSDYKTIYHLRNELLQTPAKDIRFLYLAIHNLIKRRGHFLYEGEFSENQSLSEVFNSARTFMLSLSEEEERAKMSFNELRQEDEASLLSYLKEGHGLNDSKKFFTNLVDCKDKGKCFVEPLVNGKVNLKDLFALEGDEKLSLDFNSETYELNLQEIENALTDEQLIALEKLKEVHSTLELKKILGENNFICQAMVELYEKHSKDLENFKDFIKTYYPKQKYKIFKENISKDEKKISYAIYVDNAKTNGEKRVIDAGKAPRSKDSFYALVKSVLEGPVEVENYNVEDYESRKNEILVSIENGTFLPKQRSKANGVFPNQLYRKELERILQVNETKYPFLAEKDENGITNSQKIVMILTFRLPYFVGPIGSMENQNENFAWSDRVSDERFYPWTLNNIIDLDKSEDKFIERMTNKCTYLTSEEVLPKHSILYAKFRVLNELNKLTIDGNNISVALKQDIFTNLFEKRGKVSIKALKDFLLQNNYYSKDEINNIVIGGIDKTFTNDYLVYSKLISNENFTKEFVDCNINVFEQIIKYHTIISDKNRLEKRIIKNFSSILSEKQIKFLKGLNFKDWGRLSKKFLSELYFTNKSVGTGEVTTIIDEMWNTNQNLQEILTNPCYSLKETIEGFKEKKLEDIAYENVDALYCSPAVKRSTWQAIKIIKELRDELGGMPEKIFVEVTRHDDTKGDKGRKLSRKNNINSIYTTKEFIAEVEKTDADLKRLLSELNAPNRDDSSFRSERLYLYFTQLGKCAYSGRAINIEDIYKDDLYDVDHIIPQSILKDDSLSNKVLVERNLNRDEKADHYPIFKIRPQWVEKQKDFWKMLKDFGLMTQEKYERLVRKDELTDDELSGFIARQLVETNQSTKAVIDLLRQMIDNPRNIIFSKAKIVSDFRNKYGIPKSRIVNDYHHAKDAYLNIVCGNVIHSRFTDDPRNFFAKKNKNNNVTKNFNKLFDKVIYSPKNDEEIIWKGEEDALRVKNICSKNDCLVSRMSYSSQNGQFYDETIYKKTSKSDASYPLKDESNPLSDVTKYGSYKKVKNAYFALVESDKASKKQTVKIKTIVGVPYIVLMKYKNAENKNEKILSYLEKANGLVNAKFIVEKINCDSTIKFNKGEYWFSGKTGNQLIFNNANQWRVDDEIIYYVKAIEKYMELKQSKKESTIIVKDDKYILSPASKNGNREIALTSEENIKLYDEILNQLSKDIYLNSTLQTALREKLGSNKEKFLKLNTLEQSECLFGIMKGISTGAATSDLSKLGEGKNIGKFCINENVTDKILFLVKRSVTGIKEHLVRL